MKIKLILSLLLMIMLVSTVSALQITKLDNIETFTKGAETSEYGKYEIRNSVFGLEWFQLDKVQDIELVENSGGCYSDCSATKEITLYDDSSLVDDIRFYTIEEDGSRHLQDIRDYYFVIQQVGGTIEVDDFEFVPTGEIYSNGTAIVEYVKVGSHTEVLEKEVDDFSFVPSGKALLNGTIPGEYKVTGSHMEDELLEIPYTIGEILPAGDYVLKLYGKKKPGRTVDWQIKSNGIWTEEWALWGANTLNTGLKGYWTLNDTGSGSLDSTGNNDFTQSGASTKGQQGILNSSVYQLDDIHNPGSDVVITGNNPRSISYWIKSDDWYNLNTAAVYSQIDLGHRSAGAGQSFEVTVQTSPGNDSCGIYLRRNSDDQQSIYNSNCSTQEWNHVAITYDGTTADPGFKIYWNGVSQEFKPSFHNNVTFGTTANTNAYFGSGYDVYLDEIGIWNKSLSSDEVSTLYNGGSALAYPFSGGSITLNSPIDNYNTSTSLVTFNATATAIEGATLTNISLWNDYDGTWKANKTSTNFTVLSYGGSVTNAHGVVLSIGAPFSSSLGIHINTSKGGVNITRIGAIGSLIDTVSIWDDSWNLLADATCVGSGACNGTFGFELEKDKKYYVTANYSATGTQTYYIGGGTFPYELSDININGGWDGASDTNDIYDIIDIQTESATSADIIFNQEVVNGMNWTVEACDSDGDCGFAINNRTIYLDPDAPELNITYPINGSTVTDEFGLASATIYLNYTVTDDNLQACWYYNNSANVTVTCGTNSTFSLPYGTYTHYVYANDTLGNVATESSTATYEFLIKENSQTYNAVATETSTQNFLINVSYTSADWADLNMLLFYNNTQYIATQIGTGDTIEFNRSIQVPSTGVQTNYSFYWTFALTNSTNTYYYNSSFNNQSVSPITFVECDGSYTTTAINFTLKEEATFLLLNGSLEATYNFWTGGDGSTYGTYNFKNLSDNNTNFKFCIDPPDATFTIDGVVSYSKSGYDPREYIFNDYTINNQTEEINLYLASTASTDIVTFTLYDEDDQEIEDANIYVQRWDIGTNNFYTVGILQTTSDGTATINLRLNDAWYRYTVVYNGQTYLTTTPAKETATSKILRITLAEDNPFRQFNDIDYSFTYNNNTKTLLLTYADTTGAVQTGCIKVTELFANSTAQYSKSCVQSVAGSVSETINKNGTFVGQAIFLLNTNYSSVEQVVQTINFDIGIPERSKVIGSFGQIASMVIIGTAAMIGVAAGSIPLGLFLIAVALIGMNLLGMIKIFSGVLYGLISIIILIGFTIRRKGG